MEIRKETKIVTHRQAQCSCGFCGEQHKSTLAKPVGGFKGREETLGLATSDAVADALCHVMDVLGNLLEYQSMTRSLLLDKKLNFYDKDSGKHTISIIEITQ